MPANLPTPTPAARPFQPAIARNRLDRAALVALAGLLAAALTAPAALAASANFAGASADGSRVFFTTKDKLVPGDTDRGFTDVYERSYDTEPGVEAYVTRELSTGPTGGNDAYDVSYDGASKNGEYVFFSTEEPLVEADRDHAVDIYMRNTVTGATTLVSRASASCESGGCGNGEADATFKRVTPDGKRVFFQTSESLSPADTDSSPDIYMRDLEAEPPTTTLVSVAGSCPEGATATECRPEFAGVSANGKKVFFETAETLSPQDKDSSPDIYMRDLEAEPPTTTLVSPAGTCPAEATASECRPKFRTVSADGARVFFTTGEQLSSEDTDEASDVYVWEAGTVSLVSTGPTAANEAKPATFAGSRANGERVFFQTSESLTSADTDSATDVYMRDLESEPPTTTLVSQGDPSCEEAAACGAGSANETFAGATPDGSIVYLQTSEKLAPADTDSATDVYARDLAEGTTTLVSRAAPSCESGGCGNGPEEAVFAGASAGGSLVFFSTRESLVEADTNGSQDVYVRDMGAGKTMLESPVGYCPLPEGNGCDATFAGASEDGSRVFFTTARRIPAEFVDSDSETDVYERADEEVEPGVFRWKTRLVSATNSVSLGPPTPVLTGLVPGPSGETLTPAVFGTEAKANTAIKVYTTADCSGTPVTGTVAELEEGGIAVSVEASRQTSISATASDESEVTSGCSNVLNYTQEGTPPSEETGGGETGTGTGGGETGTGTGGGETGTGGGSGAGGTQAPTYGNGIAYATPKARITFGPAFKTRRRRVRFQFVDATGQPGTRFICKLDRRRWRRCHSPLHLRHLRRGRHVFRLKARNAVGVWEARQLRRRFKVVGGQRRGRHYRARRGR